jgi:CRISPR/Cas system CSM-associated protein Csm5 (group 7 of RAMP superfamily)
MVDYLNSDFCKQHNIKLFTLLLPDQDEKRGIRGKIDEHGARIYEVANGSYEMTLRWSVQEKKYYMKININDDGSVKLIEDNGVTSDALKANNVKLGRQYEAKPLHEHEELVSQLQQKSSETVRDLERPSANATDTRTRTEILMEERNRQRTSDIYR